MKKIYMAYMFLAFFVYGFTAHAKKAELPPLECFDSGTILRGYEEGQIKTPAGTYASYKANGVPTDFLVPNAMGNSFIRIPIENKFNPSAAYLDAQELRLKVREMTSQLLETWAFSGIKDMVAYVTTFTPQDNLMLSSPFGQYVRDAFIYEFNNRGFPVRDFSARDLIVSEAGFSYGVSNGSYKTPVVSKNTAVLTGTFYRDKDYLFMNVRLVRGYDGMVLRTAQTIFPVTPLLARMTERPVPPLEPPLSMGGLQIVPGKRFK